MTAPIKVIVEGAPGAVKAFLNGADDAAKAATKVTKSADDVAAAVADKTSKASKVKDAAKTTASKSKDAAAKAADSAKDAAKKGKSGILGTVKKHPKTAIAAGLLGAGAMTLGGSDDARDTAGDLVDAAKDKISAADKWLFGGDNGDTTNPFSSTTSGEEVIEVDPAVMAAFISDLRSHAEELELALSNAPKAFQSLRDRLTKDAMGGSTRSGAASPIFEDLDAALEAAEARYVSVTKSLIAQFSGDATRLEKIVQAHMENEQVHAAQANNIEVAV